MFQISNVPLITFFLNIIITVILFAAGCTLPHLHASRTPGGVSLQAEWRVRSLPWCMAHGPTPRWRSIQKMLWNTVYRGSEHVPRMCLVFLSPGLPWAHVGGTSGENNELGIRIWENWTHFRHNPKAVHLTVCSFKQGCENRFFFLFQLSTYDETPPYTRICSFRQYHV